MNEASGYDYLVGLGSNMRVPGVGSPRAVIASALDAIADRGIVVIARSPVVETDPVGPSSRRYANAAAVLQTPAEPPDLLAALAEVERDFGRRRRGARWRARPLDLDIVLWSGGRWTTRDLTIPHPLFRERPFVLGPAARVAPDWRDPVTGYTMRQLAARASLSAAFSA